RGARRDRRLQEGGRRGQAAEVARRHRLPALARGPGRRGRRPEGRERPPHLLPAPAAARSLRRRRSRDARGADLGQAQLRLAARFPFRRGRRLRHLHAVRTHRAERRAVPAMVKRGFTLIELLVVLALIAMLLTIALPRYFYSVERSKESLLRQNLRTTRDAIDQFHGDLGRYPEDL